MRAGIPEDSWSLSRQVFADDASAAAGRACRGFATKLARFLRELLFAQLRELDIDVSATKCCNCIIEILIDNMPHAERADSRPLNVQNKGPIRKRAQRDLDWLISANTRSQSLGIPFLLRYSFKLLGVTPDSLWSFQEHIRELGTRAIRILAVLH